jgi:hypothetical protein
MIHKSSKPFNLPNGKPIYVSDKLKHKLDLLASTLDKKDIWLLVDGDEGSGKTNTACYLLWYFHCITGREFTLDRFYFDSDEMFEWVKENYNGLINWDEATLGGLSAEWWSRSQINLLKFAMMGRKKHHIFVLCIPRFNKLKVDLRQDRIHGMIHMDLGKKGNKYGNFMYITRRGVRKLNELYNKKKIRPYNVCCRKYGGFYGYIPYVADKLLDLDAYEKKKDFAISNIGKKKIDKNGEDLHKLKGMIATFPMGFKTKKELAEKLGISGETLRLWGKYPVSLENTSPNPQVNI